MDGLVAAASGGDVEFALDWCDPKPASSEPDGIAAADLTRGCLRVRLRGTPTWSGQTESDGFEWTWIELLEFLSDNWIYLSVEDGAPLGVAPGTASAMLASAENAAQRFNPLDADLETEHLEAFRLSHDLAEAVEGAVLPPLWVVRDGRWGVVASTHNVVAAPFDEILGVLEQVGDHIADRLESASDERSRRVLDAWARRESHDRSRLIEVITGYPRDLIAELEGLIEGDEADISELQNDELLAAARLVGPQPLATLEPILAAMQDVGYASRRVLDRFSKTALQAVSAASDKPPCAQGHAIAVWLRQRPGIVRSNGRVDPEEILVLFGVPVIDVEFGLKDIDAIGCWGPRRGPAVLVNASGKSAGTRNRRRSTLAHEICHLLVDRSRSLPLAEVFGGRTPEHAERRARAFAAELLLPRHVARAEFGKFVDADAAVRSLSSRFQVSAEIVAWQVKNAGTMLTSQQRHHLAQHVSTPSTYG
ncbi:ImmA/IrrE family metallo-endopeptidase [Candidatus Poriferisodalis sp.]|uniref:ImmA/IrrE family metallo-endopeptidase n=1 Tax=Candidatus Poriferisodalis sp. TaxID=3101277 RepID=UPI003B519D96